MKGKLLALLFFLLILVQLPHSLAEEMDDPELFGLELEKVFNLGSGVLATILLLFTVAAYRRTNRTRLLYVSVAFALFAVKGFLTAHELFIEEWGWVDPIASLLNVVILLTFFVGILRK